MAFIKPKNITLKSLDGEEKDFIISRIPATKARKLITQYPLTGAPKIGNYEENEKLMIQLLSFTAVIGPEGVEIPLTTMGLIDNHVADGEMLLKLEFAMMEYNTNFFKIGRVSKGLDSLSAKVGQLLTQTLTHLSAQSSAKGKQR